MPPETETGLPGRPVGRFAVSVSKDEAERFAAAVALSGEARPPEGIPPSYPIAWLGRPDIRAALKADLDALAGKPGHLPVHVSQTLTYHRALVVDTPYWLDVSLDGPDRRGGVGLEVAVRDQAEILVVHLSGVLAMISVEHTP
jgi:hypothetical protein